MNIFLPYENSIIASVQALDDKRLNKQILECVQLINIKEKLDAGEIKVGYKNHPIFVHYKDYIEFITIYGFYCCVEYCVRFDKIHKLYEWFINKVKDIPIKSWLQPNYIPFYMEGSKGQPNYVRTNSNVSKLYQSKLISKWEKDKKSGKQLKWTNRPRPSFYTTYLFTS